MEGVVAYPCNALVILVIPIAIPNKLGHRVQVTGFPGVEVFVLVHWLVWSVGESLPSPCRKGRPPTNWTWEPRKRKEARPVVARDQPCISKVKDFIPTVQKK